MKFLEIEETPWRRRSVSNTIWAHLQSHECFTGENALSQLKSPIIIKNCINTKIKFNNVTLDGGLNPSTNKRQLVTTAGATKTELFNVWWWITKGEYTINKGRKNNRVALMFLYRDKRLWFMFEDQIRNPSPCVLPSFRLWFMLVLAAHFVGTKESMWQRIASGNSLILSSPHPWGFEFLISLRVSEFDSIFTSAYKITN